MDSAFFYCGFEWVGEAEFAAMLKGVLGEPGDVGRQLRGHGRSGPGRGQLKRGGLTGPAGAVNLEKPTCPPSQAQRLERPALPAP